MPSSNAAITRRLTKLLQVEVGRPELEILKATVVTPVPVPLPR